MHTPLLTKLPVCNVLSHMPLLTKLPVCNVLSHMPLLTKLPVCNVLSHMSLLTKLPLCSVSHMSLLTKLPVYSVLSHVSLLTKLPVCNVLSHMPLLTKLPVCSVLSHMPLLTKLPVCSVLSHMPLLTKLLICNVFIQMFFQLVIRCKIKWSLCKLQRHKGSEGMTPFVLSFGTTWGGWSVLLLSLPILKERRSHALWRGSQRTSDQRTEKSLFFARNRNKSLRSSSPYPSHYTDWATPINFMTCHLHLKVLKFWLILFIDLYCNKAITWI